MTRRRTKFRTVRGQRQFLWREEWRPWSPGEVYKSPKEMACFCPQCGAIVRVFEKDCKTYLEDHREHIKDRYGNTVTERKCPASGRLGGLTVEYEETEVWNVE